MMKTLGGCKKYQDSLLPEADVRDGPADRAVEHDVAQPCEGREDRRTHIHPSAPTVDHGPSTSHRGDELHAPQQHDDHFGDEMKYQ